MCMGKGWRVLNPHGERDKAMAESWCSRELMSRSLFGLMWQGTGEREASKTQGEAVLVLVCCGWNVWVGSNLEQGRPWLD